MDRPAPLADAGPALVVVGAAAACAAVLDAVLLRSAATGTDPATRLSVILTYVGVDASYVLARALGLTALAAAWVSILLGLRRGAGARGAATHRAAGMVALLLAAAHVVVPYTSVDPPFGGWPTALIPWGQPVSWGTSATVEESAGIVALYLGVLGGPVWYLLQRRIGAWRRAHLLTVAFYLLAVGHSLLLGTDLLSRGWPRVAVLAAQVPLLALAGRRVGAARAGVALAAVALAAAVGAALGAPWAGRPV